MSNQPHDSFFGKSTNPHRYDDLLTLPHHTSKVHPSMTMQQRAAQFAPFAALTGYETVIDETARQSEKAAEKTIRFTPDIS